MPIQIQTATVLAVVAMLVLSAGVTGAAVGGTLADVDDTPATAADEIFVYENGDAVLVYRTADPSASQTTTGTFGLDVTKGLVHVFVTDQVETGVTGDATLLVKPAEISGDGTFSMTVPEKMETINVDLSLVTSKTEASGSLTLDATFANDVDSETADTSDLTKSLTTEGIVTVGPSFKSSGHATVEKSTAPADATLTYAAITLTETESGFDMTGTHSYTLSELSADDWETEAAAQQSLEEMFGAIASELDGTATVTIDSYEFDPETRALDVSYTVAFSDVKPALAKNIASMIAADRGLELTEEQLDEVAAHLEAVEVKTLSFTYDSLGAETITSWDVELDEFHHVMEADLALHTFAGTADEETLTLARQKLDAMIASEVSFTLTWGALASGMDTETSTIQLQSSYETENWERYTSELESRGIETPESTVNVKATTDDDGIISMTFTVTMKQSDLVNTLVKGVVLGGQHTADEETAAMLDAFEQAELERAKIDVSIVDGTITFEAAASFEDLSAFDDLLSEKFGGLTVDGISSEMSEGAGVSYVRVTGATVENPTIEDVRALSDVDENTVIHMPGSWDAESTTFPEMDEEKVNAFLDEEAESDAESEPMPVNLPGGDAVFAGLAAAMLVGVGIVARKRHL
ncbi:hypothetical protein [Haloarchaeobius sp. TZWWS8]|uniref:hypothetical protein n=1 Tax=Haloarchaeobius sp. TZWWS8 TaxID=3446121 RepID=UPI003EB82293